VGKQQDETSGIKDGYAATGDIELSKIKIEVVRNRCSSDIEYGVQVQRSHAPVHIVSQRFNGKKVQKRY